MKLTDKDLNKYFAYFAYNNKFIWGKHYKDLVKVQIIAIRDKQYVIENDYKHIFGINPNNIISSWEDALDEIKKEEEKIQKEKAAQKIKDKKKKEIASLKLKENSQIISVIKDLFEENNIKEFSITKDKSKITISGTDLLKLVEAVKTNHIVK